MISPLSPRRSRSKSERKNKIIYFRNSSRDPKINFNNQNIQYRIIYNGSPKNFFNNMSNKNFNIVMENNVWTVK